MNEQAEQKPSYDIFKYAVVGAIALAIAHTLDRWAAMHIRSKPATHEDWYRLLRVAGYLPTWLLIAALLMLLDRPSDKSSPTRRRWSRGAYLFVSVVFGGALAEVLKLILRRERPHTAAEYVFRSFWDRPLSTVDLGLPSSHATVAFAGAFALCRLYPAARPIWILLAAGCGLTRLLDGGHFLSDVTLGALAGYAAAWALWRAGRMANPENALETADGR